jgi:pilus assembly protein CpaB
VRAREEGRIQLTLRNPTDDAVLEPALVAEAAPVPAPAPRRKVRAEAPPSAPPSVTIIRGTNVDKSAASS